MMGRTTALAIACLCAPTLAAQTHVTLCATDTQEGAGMNLANAVRLGGTIVFDCPPQTRLLMTSGHAAPPGTIIDGGDAITLDGQARESTMFGVPSGGTLTLRRVTIRNARQRRTGFALASSVVQAAGNLTLDRVTIQTSESPVTVRGMVRILGSSFVGNQGWAVDSDGSAEIEGSTFIGNETGLALKAGTVHHCAFNQNRKSAIRVFYPSGDVRIIASKFDSNDGEGAILLSQRSLRDSPGVVTIRRSEFTMNRHPSGGGAINVYDTTANSPPTTAAQLRRFGPARFVIAYSRFSGNRGRSGGAIYADLANSSGMIVKGGLFNDNQGSDNGGAIAWWGRGMLVTHGLFRSNTAAGRGSALHARNRESGAAWAIANSLIVENVGSSAVDAGPVSLFNVTIARNSGVGVDAAAGQPMILNSILSENAAGACRGVVASAFRGGNLQFPGDDCAGVTVADPELDSRYVPGVASPAMTLGDVAVCRAAPVSRTDIVFQTRGIGDRCALGAYERPPVRRLRPREARRRPPAVAGERPAALIPNEASTFVLQALAAEAQSPQRRIDITASEGDRESRYRIEKVLPDRLRLVTSGSVGDRELLVVDGRVYEKLGATWKESSAFTPDVVPPFLSMIEQRLTGVVEDAAHTENGVDYRNFTASVLSTSAYGTTRGRLAFRIETQTSLPRRITFTGECDATACTFDQSIEYDPTLTIEPPTR